MLDDLGLKRFPEMDMRVDVSFRYLQSPVPDPEETVETNAEIIRCTG
jgi:hypothetical protein